MTIKFFKQWRFCWSPPGVDGKSFGVAQIGFIKIMWNKVPFPGKASADSKCIDLTFAPNTTAEEVAKVVNAFKEIDRILG